MHVSVLARSLFPSSEERNSGSCGFMTTRPNDVFVQIYHEDPGGWDFGLKVRSSACVLVSGSGEDSVQ